MSRLKKQVPIEVPDRVYNAIFQLYLSGDAHLNDHVVTCMQLAMMGFPTEANWLNHHAKEGWNQIIFQAGLWAGGKYRAGEGGVHAES